MSPTDEERADAIQQGAIYLIHFCMYSPHGLSGFRFSAFKPQFKHDGAVEVINLNGRTTVLHNCSVLIDRIA